MVSGFNTSPHERLLIFSGDERLIVIFEKLNDPGLFSLFKAIILH
jgi:hypothetical protein